MNSGENREIALAASPLGDARVDVLTGINSLVRRSSNRLISSRGLGWKGVSLELHNASPADRNDSLSADHLIALFTDHVSRGESSVWRGRFVPYSHHSAAIHLFPAGSIPACRPFTPTKMIVCALDPAFVGEVGRELDSPTVKEFRRTMDLRDVPLQGIVMLLSAEADSGGLSRRLYAEHLAHALALRFLWLSGGTRVARPSQCEKRPNRVLQRVLDKMKADLATDLDLKHISCQKWLQQKPFLAYVSGRNGMSAASMDTVTGGRGEDNVAARRLQFSDRHRARLRIFQPCALFQHASSDRRSNAQQISPQSRSVYVKRAPFRKQLFRAFTIL
jgi:AraC family transcriptional regulator